MGVISNYADDTSKFCETYMSEMLEAGLLQAIEAIFNENAFESIYDEVLFTCGQIGADSE